MILSPGPDLALEPGVLPTVSTSVPVNAVPEPNTSNSGGDSLTLEQAERNHIVSVLKQTQGRIDGLQGAARILNVHPNTLRSRMKKLGIHRSDVQAS